MKLPLLQLERAYYLALNEVLTYDGELIKCYAGSLPKTDDNAYLLIGDDTLSDISDKSRYLFEITKSVYVVTRQNANSGSKLAGLTIAEALTTHIKDCSFGMDDFRVVATQITAADTSSETTDTEFIFVVSVQIKHIVEQLINR